MSEQIDPSVLEALAHVLVADKLSYSVARPVLQQLVDATNTVGIGKLLAALDQHSDPAFQTAADELRAQRIQDALAYFCARTSGVADTASFQLMLGDLPLNAAVGRVKPIVDPQKLSALLKVVHDRRYTRGLRDRAPVTAACIEKTYHLEGRRYLIPLIAHDPEFLLTLVERFRARVDESDQTVRGALDQVEHHARQYVAGLATGDDSTGPFDPQHYEHYHAAGTREERHVWLDRLCATADPTACAMLSQEIHESSDQSRAAAILTTRFGLPPGSGWIGWQNWFRRMVSGDRGQVEQLHSLVLTEPAEVLVFWYGQQSDHATSALSVLEDWCESHAMAVDSEKLVDIWHRFIPGDEWNVLLSAGEAVTLSKQRAASRAALASSPVASPTRVASSAVTTAEPPAPTGPSLWDDHLRPFFAEQWYIVAGVIMMIAGSSLLAYYTWDKHWLVRYSIMPLLLAGFTWTLGWLGDWTEKRDSELRATAAILRGAAIGLLPVNFMAVALLSQDDQVSQQAWAVIAMSTVYLFVFGRGLKRWCGGVHAPMGWLLGGTLLVLNSLVMVGPIATTVAHVDSSALKIAVGIGFHVGFLIMAAAVIRFTRRVLTLQIVEDERIAWFFGATLAITFVQVFIWVHSYLRHVPEVSTYALMVVLAGGLVLLVERRALELLQRTDRHRGESFMGFALLILGVLMGSTQPHLRVASFVLAGIIWLYQAAHRVQPLHHWIGLTLLCLGGASIGMVPGFPGPWLPVLGIGIAAAMSVMVLYAGRPDRMPLRDAAIGMQASVLMITAVVAVLTQWHFRNPPLWTGACLAGIAAGFGFRAWRDQKLRYTHTAMTMLAVALPYFGCVDVLGRSLHGNTMPFGLAILSLLWLGLNALTSARMVREGRSTVLWIYGSIGVAAMLLRVAFETGLPGDALWYRAAMDYSGPLLLAVALVLTTWYSRSLVPASMAGVVLVILFPELKARFRETFEIIQWGSGLGSACSALGLMVGCFLLRPARFLKDLGPGDRFMGYTPFPFRRFDHTLFTWPLLASIVFLTVKTDTVTLVRNLAGGGVGLKTAMALGATAITWKLLAAFYHDNRQSIVGTYLGCGWIFVSLWFATGHLFDGAHWSDPILAGGLILQALYLVYHFLLEPKFNWVAQTLSRPTANVLDTSAVVFPVLSIVAMLSGADTQRLLPFVAFSAAQLVWHGIARRRIYHGYLLFSLVVVALLALTAPGSDALISRVSINRSLSPTLWLMLGVFGLHVLMEFRPRVQQSLAPLTDPALWASTVMMIGLILFSYRAALQHLGFNNLHYVLIIVVGLLASRTHRSLAITLLVLAAAYLHLSLHDLDSATLAERLETLTSPWRVGSFGLSLSVLGYVGQRIYRRQPRLIEGQFSQPYFRSTNRFWLLGPALALAVAATGLQTFDKGLREIPVQLWASFPASATWIVISLQLRQRRYAVGGILLLVVANVHVVRTFAGDWLRAQGISEIQLACGGIAMTLLMLTAVRYAVRRDSVSVLINQVSLGLAGGVLVLLSANYFVHPNLAEIPWQRFVISGVMAYIAGLYFRRAARHPDAGEAGHVDLCEGLYHFGVTLASWCGLLLIPQLRHPAVALCALGLPVAYFYLRAELGTRAGQPFAKRYGNSAAVLGFVVLAGYTFRAMFQMVLFPDEPRIETDYYHYNAPFILLLSVVLLRLKALGGTWWLGVYGGLSLIVSTYFCVTSIPQQSPFEFPVAGAWWAIGLSHFFTLVSQQRSPLRTAVQRLANIDGPQWLTLRRIWGVFLLVGAHVAVAWALTHWQANTKAVAPLLAGVASLLIHHGVLRRSAIYFGIAGVQVLIALHMDFAIPGYLPRDWIVWVVAGVWSVLLAMHAVVVRRVTVAKCGTVAAAFAALMFVHVIYHHPESSTGLWGMSILAVLAALTPRYSRTSRSGEEAWLAALWLLTPVWLAWFSQSHLRETGLDGVLELWPTLVAVSTVLLIGSFARWFQLQLHSAYDQLVRPVPRLFDHTLAWMSADGGSINLSALLVTFAVTVASQVMHYGRPFQNRELVLMLTLYAGLATGWFFEARLRRSMLPYILLQLCVVGFFAVARRQLMLTTDFWTAEYDIWTSLGVSFALTGAKQFLDLQPREVRIPLLGTLFALPVVGMVWVLYNHLGTDTALMVIGLHSMMFAFMGRDSRESPYNIVAVGGFAAFVVLAFWSRFHFRVLHAYTIPIGLAILILLQLFRDRIAADTRNRIRLVTLLTVIGSVAWYALVDDRYPVAFNMTLIVVCIAAMLFGSFFRIRLYLLIGFAGLVVDVLSLVYKTMVTMERSSRMTVIGSLVLLVGVSLVFGAIYYKTNRERLNEQLDRWRKTLGAWE